jgi:hypothetical protein
MRERSGLVIVQRDEGALLSANVAYHLSVGASRIVIVDNCSEDAATLDILRKLSDDVNITVVYDKSQVCDQARLANRGLSVLLADRDIQWVFPCDADEFIWCGDSLEAFLSRCRRNNTLYGTLPWLNHIPESPPELNDPLFYLRGSLFYSPFPEKGWQQFSHFRKAFCHRHPGMEIVVGGHFFRREANPSFFAALSSCPAELSESEGVIFHYEMRDCASALLRKWRNLAERHLVSGVKREGLWNEKEKWMGQLWARYENHEEDLFEHFAQARRTYWGTEIPSDRLRRHEELSQALSRAGVLTPLPPVT